MNERSSKTTICPKCNNAGTTTFSVDLTGSGVECGSLTIPCECPGQQEVRAMSGSNDRLSQTTERWIECKCPTIAHHIWCVMSNSSMSYDQSQPTAVVQWERLLAMKPSNVPTAVWKGSVALALVRHPNAAYPQPQDQADALTVLAACAPQLL